jgi:hypothetical protein
VLEMKSRAERARLAILLVTGYFRQPFIGSSIFATARSSGQTETYSFPRNWIR